jgi:hypothetical protein
VRFTVKLVSLAIGRSKAGVSPVSAATSRVKITVATPPTPVTLKVKFVRGSKFPGVPEIDPEVALSTRSAGSDGETV